jgi:hypothetical protein
MKITTNYHSYKGLTWFLSLHQQQTINYSLQQGKGLGQNKFNQPWAIWARAAAQKLQHFQNISVV